MGEQAVRPLFLLSLPRSGSTLLQHLLAAHPHIAATAEPWIQLPLVYALRPQGVAAEYGHDTMAVAISDFVESVGGIDAWRSSIRRWAEDLYLRAAAPDAAYFLDKTPQYDLVADELVSIFPDAKVILLWRNPLAIVSSILRTFDGPGWPLYPYAPHLFQGLATLVQVHERMRERVLDVRYEDIVEAPMEALKRIFGYLQLDMDEAVVETFGSLRLRGRMKDPKWGHYSGVSREPLDRWREGIQGPLRTHWCRRYLRWIGPRRLALMGYDYDALMSELRRSRGSLRTSLRDAWRLGIAIPKARLKSRLLRTDFVLWPTPGRPR